MMKSPGTRPEGEHGVSAMALTFAFIAAVLMIGTGLIIFVYALFGQLKTTDIIFNIRPATWRVLMLAGGAGLVAAGGNLFVGKYWARVIGLGMSVVVMAGALLNLQSDPLFAVGVLCLNFAIIYALGARWTDIKSVVG